MKALFTSLCIFIQIASYGQAMWRDLGSSDFNHPSYGPTASGNDTAKSTRLVVKNGTIYLMKREYSAGGFFVLSKYINYWQHIETPYLSTSDVYAFAVDNNEVPYLFFNDATVGKAVVKKFNGINWVDLDGTEVTSETSQVLEMSIGTDNLPVIMYEDNGLTKVKRFNGNAWITLSNSDLDGYPGRLKLDSNNVPYCCFSGSNVGFIKKYNGVGWEEIGITGFSGGIHDFAIDNNNQPCVYLGTTRSLRKFNGTTWEGMQIPPSLNGEISLYYDSANTFYANYTTTSLIVKQISKFVGGTWQPVVGDFCVGRMELFLDGTNVYFQYSQMNNLPIVGKKLASGRQIFDGPSDIATPSPIASNIYVIPDLLFKNGVPLISYRNYAQSGFMTIKEFSNENGWRYYNNEPAVTNVAVINAKILNGGNGGLTTAYLSSTGNSVSRVSVKNNNGGSWNFLGPANFSLEAESELAFKINHANVPYVVYKSGRVQKFVENSWELVGGSAFTGEKAVDLAFDSNDQAYMIYAGLVVKKLNGNNWEEMGTADLAAFPNAKLPKIICDSNNNIIISFVDNARNIHVMQWNGSNWVAVGLPISNAGLLSLAVSSDNIIHVFHARVLPNNSKISANVVKFNGSAWETVGQPDFSLATIYEGVLKFSPNNTPFVAYSSPWGTYCKYFGDQNALDISAPGSIETASIIVWPNPSNATISVKSTAHIEQIDLFDLAGKKLQSTHESEVDITTLQKGFYLLRVKTESGVYTEKVAKN